MNFNKLYLFLAECFLLSFLSGVDFFNLDLYLFLSLLYGTQVYSFAAIPAICRLCLHGGARYSNRFLIECNFWREYEKVAFSV